MTDFLTDKLEISLYLSTAAFAVILSAIFTVWYAVERTLSIDKIVTLWRELFYWAAIPFTLALGTALGDLATEALEMGFNLGVTIFGALILHAQFERRTEVAREQSSAPPPTRRGSG